MTKTRIFLVEDHPITRGGLAQLIDSQADMEVCGWAEDAVQAVTGVDQTEPDLIITDLSLKGTDGLVFLKQIRPRHPDLRVLILSMHEESLYGQRALRAGARGYIMKAEAPEKLLLAVRRILRGEVYLSEKESARALANFARGGPPALNSPAEQLSDRELEVFRCIGRGLSLREIAGQLHLSVKTVETHRMQLMERLDIHDIAGLVRYALRVGLIEQGT